MKISLATSILLATALFFACKKEKKEEMYWPLGTYWKGPQTYGKVHALRNGEVWEGSGIASYLEAYPTCSISFGTFDPIDSVSTEDLSFSKVPYRVGQFVVHNSIVVVNNPIWVDSLSSLYALLYDDLAGPFFYVDTTKNNWILIESIDSIQKIIKGKFDVTYRIEPNGEANTKYPREVHFSEGMFEVKVHQ